MLYKMTKEEKLYMDYLENHIYNVYHSFDLIKGYLAKHLDFDEVMMKKRLNIHDASKFGEEEFVPYKEYFYPETSYFKWKDKNRRIAFEKAWEHHYLVNDHHPEFWVTNKESIKDKNLEVISKDMSDEAIVEMLCDWTAMSLAKRTVMKDWYDSADDKSRIFSKNTKEIVDRIMNESWTSVIHLASLEGLK